MNRRRAAGVVAVFVAIGCGSPSGLSWQQALEGVDLSKAIFSLSYFAEPPAGAFLTSATQVGVAPADACQAYMTAEPPADLWYLGIDTSATVAGSYSVVTRLELPSAVPSARATLVHVRAGEKVESITAVAGEVRVDTAPPDAASWQQGVPLAGHVDLQVPANPWRRDSCTGGQAPGDPVATLNCDCISAEGKRASCAASSSTDDCCAALGADGETTSVSADLVAAQCPWMCKFASPALARECLGLE